MTPLSLRLQPLFQKTRTVCFGHFMLDIPVTATVVFGVETVEWPIRYYPGEAANMAKHVANTLTEVEKDRKYLDERDLPGLSRFGTVEDGIVPGQKLVFGSTDHFSYTIDSFIPLGKDLFIQRAERVENEKEQVSVLNTVARNLRFRHHDEIPTEAGSCIDGGFVAAQAQHEETALGVRLAEFPDVHFSINATKKHILVESDALEPRLKGAEQDARKQGLGAVFARIKTFRRGPRQIGDWSGFEILARKPAHGDDTESHEFLFLSQGVPKDPLRPVLDLQLNTGVDDNRTASVRPSLTDEEAVALWDKLSSSIRVRPVGGARGSNTGQPKTPLGTFIESGSKCPQTGWWQCSDIGEVAGGRRRHFKEGDLLSQADLLGRPSVWQKLMGTRPTQEIATVWKLVDYDPLRDGEVSNATTETSPERSGVKASQPSKGDEPGSSA